MPCSPTPIHRLRPMAVRIAGPQRPAVTSSATAARPAPPARKTAAAAARYAATRNATRARTASSAPGGDLKGPGLLRDLHQRRLPSGLPELRLQQRQSPLAGHLRAAELLAWRLNPQRAARSVEGHLVDEGPTHTIEGQTNVAGFVLGERELDVAAFARRDLGQCTHLEGVDRSPCWRGRDPKCRRCHRCRRRHWPGTYSPLTPRRRRWCKGCHHCSSPRRQRRTCRPCKRRRLCRRCCRHKAGRCCCGCSPWPDRMHRSCRGRHRRITRPLLGICRRCRHQPRPTQGTN